MAKTENPLLVVITGCSGVGKDTIIDRMKERQLPFFFAVTATSRAPRAGEINGVDYQFIDRPRFNEMINKGEFLEWANVYGNLYGVPATTVRQAMAEGKDAIVKVDIQGANTIKRLEPEAVTIFLSPPSMEDLQQRLGKRGTESQAELKLRLSTAHREMESIPFFDHVVVSQNNRVDQAISEIMDIVKDEKCRADS